MKDFILNTLIAFAGIMLFAEDAEFVWQIVVGVISILSVRAIMWVLKGE